MTVYALPPEPEGPLWDARGHRWERQQRDHWDDHWENGAGERCLWRELLDGHGPLTDELPEPPVGEVRWDHSHPRLFVVRGLDGDGPCWRGGHGTEIPDDIVERYYTRTEPAPAEEGEQ